MNLVKVSGTVDANHQLWARVPATIPPGPVTVVIVPVPQKDDAGGAWAAGVAQEWTDELSDPGQDIYTLADGEPVGTAIATQNRSPVPPRRIVDPGGCAAGRQMLGG